MLYTDVVGVTVATKYARGILGHQTLHDVRADTWAYLRCLEVLSTIPRYELMSARFNFVLSQL